MYKHIDTWDAFSERLAHPLDYLFELVRDDDLLLFMPYMVKHDRTEVICRLIEPKSLGIDHEWCAEFVRRNEDRIRTAKSVGRACRKDNRTGCQAVVARIFTTIAEFESNRCLYEIHDFEQPYAKIKAAGPDPEGFEWEGLDETYPVALLAKTDAGEAGQLCSLVVTLVYKSADRSKSKNREFVEKYLTSLAKYKINVAKVAKELGDLDAKEWNAFRSCFNDVIDFGNYKFHHAAHGGDAKTIEWSDVKAKLKPVVKDLLIGANYPLESACKCSLAATPNTLTGEDPNCSDQVLGWPKDKPSVRELLQWDHMGQSLTRVLLMLKPKSLNILGQLNHDHCWFNPLGIEELINKIGESSIHNEERAASISNSGILQSVYAFEEDNSARKGFWLFAHIPGILTPMEWGELGGFGMVIRLARRSGVKKLYRIDFESISMTNVWSINENHDPWASKVSKVEEEFGSEVKNFLPQSGLALFIPAQNAKDGRECWEISVE